MQILIGLTNTALTTLDHLSLSILCHSSVAVYKLPVEKLSTEQATSLLATLPAHAGTESGTASSSGSNLHIVAKNNRLIVSGDFSQTLPNGVAIVLRNVNGTGKFSVLNISRQHAKNSTAPVYDGALQIFAQGDNVRCNLVCDLESYVRGVLQSEVPESYHVEAIKAQAVAARTYGLHPRVDHTKDNCQVCDSYLCCQYFGGAGLKLAGRYLEAIDGTRNQVLIWNDKPVLALFSSCSGGHTEDYENCFSDQSSNAFPGERLEYLRGVPEGNFSDYKSSVGSESWLRELWAKTKPDTCDAWSSQFRWSVNLSADALEAHMHHVVGEEMLHDPQYAPFIVPPKSGKFGHIKEFHISKRGVSGTGMVLEIQTSTGVWQIKKELVIRSAFKNSDASLKRLKSAKVFFEHTNNNLGLLDHLKISGLGWGAWSGHAANRGSGSGIKRKILPPDIAALLHVSIGCKRLTRKTCGNPGNI